MDLMSRRRALMAQAQKLIVLATATGNPMTFTTDLVRPLHSLVIPFTPIQADGTPSPNNLLPISGWTGANVRNAKKNLFDKSKMVTLTGALQRYMQYGVAVYSDNTPTGLLRLEPGNYVFSLSGDNSTIAEAISVYDQSLTRLAVVYNNKVLAFTVSQLSNCFISCTISTENFVSWDNYNIQLEKGSTPTEYEPFRGQTLPINWQSEAGTVYSGTVTLNEDRSADVVADRVLDVVSALESYAFAVGTESACWRCRLSHTSTTVTVWNKHGAISNYGTENTAYYGSGARVNEAASLNNLFAISTDGGILAIYDADTTLTLDQIKAKYANMQVCYPLATPQTYHLDNVGQLVTYLGTNTIWTDTNGTNTAEYWIKNT